MAISPRKLAANQETALRSTGPRTPEGKARVRHNALKHGLLAKEVIVPVGDEQEKRAEFDLFLDDLWQHYAPIGPIEAMLVDRIAVAYWRLRRATRAEVGELRLEFDKAAGSGAVVLFSGIVERLQKQFEEADPNFDLATWLRTDDNAATLGWDVKSALADIKGLAPAERKPCPLRARETTHQRYLERGRREVARGDRRYHGTLVQR